MSLSGLLAFTAAYLAVLVLPGPGVTSLVARVLARGPQGSPAFIAGFVAGALIWFAVAVTGLAALAASFAAVFVAIRYAGAAYLLYVAWKLWHAPAVPPDRTAATPERGWRLFLTGLAINLGNPKVIVFFLALIPSIVDMGRLTGTGIVELAALIVVIASTVLGIYAAAAARARSTSSPAR